MGAGLPTEPTTIPSSYSKLYLFALSIEEIPRLSRAEFGPGPSLEFAQSRGDDRDLSFQTPEQQLGHGLYFLLVPSHRGPIIYPREKRRLTSMGMSIYSGQRGITTEFQERSLAAACARWLTRSPCRDLKWRTVCLRQFGASTRSIPTFWITEQSRMGTGWTYEGASRLIDIRSSR